MSWQIEGHVRKDPSTVEFTIPGPVASMSATASGTSATVVWTAPTSDGGAAITGYMISRDGLDSNGSGPWGTTVTANTLTFTFTNLVAGSTYTFTVIPINSYGQGNAVTATATVPDPTPPATRGAAAIGTASYSIPFPVPSTYLFVDGSSAGSDTTGDGSSGSPFKTFGKALTTATATGTWTIVMKAGEYHYQNTSSPSTKKINVQNMPGHVVWFDGSVVVPTSSWTNLGNGTWSTPLSVIFQQTLHDVTDTSTLNGAPNMKAEGGAASNAGQNEQCWLDGNLLATADYNATPTAAQFSVHNYGNASTQTIVIGTNPSGHELRISDYRVLWVANNVTSWYGVGIRRYSPDDIEKPEGAALYYGGTSAGSTFENCWFRQIGMTALSILKDDCTIQFCTFEYNGQCGVVGSVANRLLLYKCVVQFNNTRLWRAGPETAGIKVTKGDQIRIDDNLFFNNNMANGIWYDWSAVRPIVINNEVGSTSSVTQSGSSQGATGIQFEEIDGGNLSGTQYYGYVCNNHVYGFRWNIRIIATGYIKIWNNTLENHSEADFYLWTDRGPNPGNDGRLSSQDPWIERNLEICNNNFIDGGSVYAQILNYDSYGPAPNYRSGTMQVSKMSGNRFAPLTSGHLCQWGNTDGSRPNYDTLAALMARADLASATWVNYQQSTLPADGTAGEPLPSDIATLLGKSTGVRHIGIF
jgi:hypothetical protein